MKSFHVIVAIYVTYICTSIVITAVLACAVTAAGFFLHLGLRCPTRSGRTRDEQNDQMNAKDLNLVRDRFKLSLAKKIMTSVKTQKLRNNAIRPRDANTKKNTLCDWNGTLRLEQHIKLHCCHLQTTTQTTPPQPHVNIVGKHNATAARRWATASTQLRQIGRGPFGLR